MEPDAIRQRQQAHALLDMLPDEKLTAVRGLLEVMVEPLSRSLACSSRRRGDHAGDGCGARPRASLDCGEGSPHEEILREFGLTK